MRLFVSHAPTELDVNRSISESTCSAVSSLPFRASSNAHSSQRDIEKRTLGRKAVRTLARSCKNAPHGETRCKTLIKRHPHPEFKVQGLRRETHCILRNKKARTSMTSDETFAEKRNEAQQALRRKPITLEIFDCTTLRSSLAKQQTVSMKAAMKCNFPNVQYILDTLVDSLVTSAAVEIFLFQDPNYEPVRKVRWKIRRPICSILSNRDQAKVHVFSGAVFCVWERTRCVGRDGKVFYEMEGSSTIRRDDVTSKLVGCKFRVNPGNASMQVLGAIKQHVSSTDDSFGIECTPATTSRRIVFTGLMSELGVTDKPPPEPTNESRARLGQDTGSSWKALQIIDTESGSAHPATTGAAAKQKEVKQTLTSTRVNMICKLTESANHCCVLLEVHEQLARSRSRRNPCAISREM